MAHCMSPYRRRITPVRTSSDVLKEHLKKAGNQAMDLGTHTRDSVDYPDFAR